MAFWAIALSIARMHRPTPATSFGQSKSHKCLGHLVGGHCPGSLLPPPRLPLPAFISLQSLLTPRLGDPEAQNLPEIFSSQRIVIFNSTEKDPLENEIETGLGRQRAASTGLSHSDWSGCGGWRKKEGRMQLGSARSSGSVGRKRRTRENRLRSQSWRDGAGTPLGPQYLI